MAKINTVADLEKVIQQLKYEQTGELKVLKEQFYTTCGRFTPINIIKGTTKDAMVAPGLKSDLVNAAIGMATGIMAKKALIGSAQNPIRKLFGFILEMVVANKVAGNTDGIKTAGSALLKKILSSHNDTEKA